MSIEVIMGWDFEASLKVFLNRFKKSGVLAELKLRESYESPSEKRRRKKADNIKRSRKRELATIIYREYLSIERIKTQQQFAKEKKEKALHTMIMVLPEEVV